MAKMFYSVEEAAEKLSKSVEEVRQLASSGQLQEFRDRDRLVFKKEQVDLLASGDEGEVGIPLADSKGNSGLGLRLDDSGGGSGAIELDEPKERSGISIFDTESTEEGDPSAVTRVTETGRGELTMEAVGSGSGLLDLTREADDTSLGADLLEDVYKADESAAGQSETQGASGLFETTGAASDVSMGAGAIAGMPAMAALAEPYDGKGSAWTGGMLLGLIVVTLVLLAGVMTAIIGAAENPVISMLSSNMFMWVGIFAGVVFLLGIVGFLIGKK
jgi:hypothetical protein